MRELVPAVPEPLKQILGVRLLLEGMVAGAQLARRCKGGEHTAQAAALAAEPGTPRAGGGPHRTALRGGTRIQNTAAGGTAHGQVGGGLAGRTLGQARVVLWHWGQAGRTPASEPLLRVPSQQGRQSCQICQTPCCRGQEGHLEQLPPDAYEPEKERVVGANGVN